MEKYNSSDFINRGFTSFALIFNAYKIIISITTIFIAIISFLIFSLIIKKAVERNYQQIGTLRALGYSKFAITSSYWVYAILSCCIALPIGWFLGTIGQIAIIEIFSSMFIIPNNTIYLDFTSLAIGFFVLAILTITCASVIVLKAINIPISELFHSQINYNKSSKFILKIYHRYFAFGSFKTRFRIILAAVSYKKLFLMALTILIASFTILLSLLIPINILSLDKSYYHDINYQTSVEFYQGINNMPLNRYNFFPWQGIEYETTDPMYPIGENRLISEYMKQKNDAIWTNIDNPKSPNSINLSDIINQISYNMFDFSGKAISLGWLEAMDNKYHGTATMNAVSNIVCPIFNLIANGTNDIDNNQDWRQCVENVIASEMPSFVKKYLNNAKTKNRFAIGFNTLPYIPLEDELLTHYNSKINNENIKTHGIKPNNKMVKISDELQNKLKTTKTINNKIIIPIIINKSLQIKHHLNVGNIIDFTNTTRSLQYTTNENKWNKIPNNWWGYNLKNQEFINGKWEPQPNTENIWKMPNDKFTSTSDKVTYGWTNRYGYQGINDNDKDIAQQYSNAKTYRNLNDIILRLPKNDIKDNNGNIIYQGISAATNNYFETLEAKQLPTGHQDKFIIATDETNNKWWVIRPYSIFWNNKTKQYINNSDFSSALNLITNGKNLFTLLSSAYWQSKPEEMKIGIDHFANESNIRLLA